MDLQYPRSAPKHPQYPATLTTSLMPTRLDRTATARTSIYIDGYSCIVTLPFRGTAGMMTLEILSVDLKWLAIIGVLNCCGGGGSVAIM